MDISVIIPTWNRATLLPRALESVLSQTLLPREIIVVDDGSNDTTRELVCCRYPEVKYLYQPNQGVSAARNVGIRESTSDWVAFLDSDDQWLPGKLEAQHQAICDSPAMRVCHTDEIWIRNGKRVNSMKKHAKPDGWIFEQCLPLCCVSPSSILAHRCVLDDVGLFDESLPACEDYDLWLRIFSRYPVLLVEQQLLNKFGGHDDQLSQKYWGMDRFRVQAMDKLLEAGRLNQNQMQTTRNMLGQKLDILIKGYTKRDNRDEVELCNHLKSKWLLA
jgi:glycosyltransferase involved in cell wall biosynthesis